MAVCARVAKLGSAAYGTRHARVRPSVIQCELAVTVTVVIKPSRLNIVAQGLSSSLPRSLPEPLYTPLSKKERSRAASTLNTHHQETLMVLRNTTLSYP